MFRRSGFTLIEMAMVMIVMGIIVGSSTKIFTTLAKNSKIKETQDRLNILGKNIEGFVRIKHRLPTENEFYSFSVNMRDSWGKKIRYIPSNELLKDICSVKHTRLTQIQESKKVTNQAFIMLSSGANRSLQTKINKQLIISAPYGKNIDINKGSTHPIQVYDDLYLDRSLWFIRAQVECHERIRR